MKNYMELKSMLESIIKKVKDADPERGLYLEQHITWDDMGTFSYTGEKAIMDELLNRVKIRN